MNIFDRYKVVIENTDNPVVLEIGAAEGEDTLRYVTALISLRRPFTYLAFEPDPKNILKLEGHILRGYFQLCAYALGDHSGTAPWRSSSHPFSGSVKEPREHLTLFPHISFSEPTTVPMEKLDTVCVGLPRVDWIWCDVQGAEDLVLAGGKETFSKTRFFYTEYIECEAYEGQIGRDEILRRLPGLWRIAEDYRQWEKGGDCLFERLTSP
jgi:FkbM family methyltransferase